MSTGDILTAQQAAKRFKNVKGYVEKPFDFATFVAKIKATMR